VNDNSESHGYNDECWQKVGTGGSRTCPDLSEFVHCRNCPKYSDTVIKLLDREPPEGYLETWTSLLAAEKEVESRGTVPITIFRLGNEWLALNTDVMEEMTDVRPVHRIPHRTNNILLGVVNVRGMLQLCVSLRSLLGIAEPEDEEEQKTGHKELVVLNRDGDRWAFVADEIEGIHRIAADELTNVPVTVAKATSRYTKNLFRFDNRNVGYLDDELIFYSLKRSVL